MAYEQFEFAPNPKHRGTMKSEAPEGFVECERCGNWHLPKACPQEGYLAVWVPPGDA